MIIWFYILANIWIQNKLCEAKHSTRLFEQLERLCATATKWNVSLHPMLVFVCREIIIKHLYYLKWKEKTYLRASRQSEKHTLHLDMHKLDANHFLKWKYTNDFEGVPCICDMRVFLCRASLHPATVRWMMAKRWFILLQCRQFKEINKFPWQWFLVQQFVVGGPWNEARKRSIYNTLLPTLIVKVTLIRWECEKIEAKASSFSNV